MNANELADNLIPFATDYKISNLDCMILSDAITMLRQQQAEIEALKAHTVKELTENITGVWRLSDQSIQIVFTSCRSASEFEAILRKAQEK